jgi:hypothetical protein
MGGGGYTRMGATQLSKTPRRVRQIARPAKVVHAAWQPRTRPQSMMLTPRYIPSLEICCARYWVGNSAARKPGFLISSLS